MIASRRTSLLVGLLLLLASVGTISYVSAAGDTRINACANKTTGIIRYIEKGSCKKTEKAISWSQQGVQGVQGNTGKSGADGTPGISGSKGDPGVDGQNFHIVDADGNDLGIYLGPSDISYGFSEDWILLDSNALTWRISSTTYDFNSPDPNAGIGLSTYYKDSYCTLPLINRQFVDQQLPSLQSVFILHVGAGRNLSSAYIRTGPAYSALTAPLPYYLKGSVSGTSCIRLTSDERAYRMQYFSAFADTELVPLPTYRPPLKIVRK